MELDRVEKLAKILNEQNLTHLEINDKEGHIILQKSIITSSMGVDAKLYEPKEVKTTVKTINAPFVGTFYTSEQPDKAPLIKPGDTVEKGQAVGIIEAMKMMNEVKSDVSGTIDQILVTNGDAVEYDQPLFSLKE